MAKIKIKVHLNEWQTENFEYEYDDDILEEEIIKVFAKDYGIPLKIAKKLCNDLDLLDQLKNFYEDYDELNDNLKDRLYDEAMEEYYEIENYEEGE